MSSDNAYCVTCPALSMLYALIHLTGEVPLGCLLHRCRNRISHCKVKVIKLGSHSRTLVPESRFLIKGNYLFEWKIHETHRQVNILAGLTHILKKSPKCL